MRRRPDPYAVVRPPVYARDNLPPGGVVKIARACDWLVIDVAPNAPPPMTLPRRAEALNVTPSRLAALTYRWVRWWMPRLRVVRGSAAARLYDLTLP